MAGNFLQRFVALVGLEGLRSADARTSDWAVMRTAIREGQAAFVESRPAALNAWDGKTAPGTGARLRASGH